jgi:hypothetical protein
MESHHGLGLNTTNDISQSKFVIADKFPANNEKIEETFRKYFEIESRSDISINVKYASKLERKRRCDHIKKLVSNKCSKKVVECLETLLE